MQHTWQEPIMRTRELFWALAASSSVNLAERGTSLQYSSERKLQDMKRKLFLFASAVVLLATPAVAADTVKIAARKLPPVPASSRMQIPPAPTTPATPAASAPRAPEEKNYTIAQSRPYTSKIT